MINFIIPLLSSMTPMWNYVLIHIFALMFIATVPRILRAIIGVGGKKFNV